jgi:hypothetical protein
MTSEAEEERGRGEQSALDVSLGPGMSVVPTMRIDHTPSLYERLRRRL